MARPRQRPDAHTDDPPGGGEAQQTGEGHTAHIKHVFAEPLLPAGFLGDGLDAPLRGEGGWPKARRMRVKPPLPSPLQINLK